jgi:hypothetical protein
VVRRARVIFAGDHGLTARGVVEDIVKKTKVPA